MKKLLFATVLAAVIAFGSAELFARGGRQDGPGYGPGGGYGYSAIPNLTTEQSSKIQALQKKHVDEIAPIQESMLKKRNEMRSLWLSKEPDQAKINALQKDISDLRLKIQEKGTNLRFDIRKLLTPEQQAQFSLNGPGMGNRHGMGKSGRMGR